MPGAEGPAHRRLRDLNAHRDALAHGHFDQNPFDGSYVLLEKRKAREYPVGRVLELAEALQTIAEEFRHTEAFYFFDAVEDPEAPSPKADPTEARH